MQKIRRRFGRVAWWMLPAGHAALIYWSSSLTTDEIPSLLGEVWDKLLHGAAYGLLAFLILLAVNGGLRRPVGPLVFCGAVLASLLFGLIDEWHQSMVATRVASGADLLADLLGSLAAVPIYRWLSGHRRGFKS